MNEALHKTVKKIRHLILETVKGGIHDNILAVNYTAYTYQYQQGYLTFLVTEQTIVSRLTADNIIYGMTKLLKTC